MRHRIQNIIRNTFSELLASHYKSDRGIERNRGDTEKGGNNTSETLSIAISKLSFHNSKEIRWRDSLNFSFTKRNYSCKGHIDFSFAKSGISDKCQDTKLVREISQLIKKLSY